MKGKFLTQIARVMSGGFRFKNQNLPALLMFHGFTDREHQGCENCQHKHLHVQKMESFLAHLKKHHAIISLEHLLKCLADHTPIPRNAVVLTFDDGFQSNHTLAYPLLKRYEAPAIIYLATEFVDEGKPIWTDRIDYAFAAAGKLPKEMIAAKQQLKKLPQEQIEEAVSQWERSLGKRLADSRSLGIPDIYRPLNWEQIQEMQASGLVSFGAHTHQHPILGRSKPETVREELQHSKSLIEQHLQTPCDHFCYPNGSHGDFSDQTEQCVKELGFKSSVTTLNGRVHAASMDAYLLPRLGITNDLDLGRFDLMVSGFTAWLENLRGNHRV